jgi:hypothetical protein
MLILVEVWVASRSDVIANDDVYQSAIAAPILNTRHLTPHPNHKFSSQPKPNHTTMASRLLRPAFRAPIARFTTRRTFLISPTLRIKEDADRTPEQLEAAKQSQLREQEKGEGRWREDLASHGESNIAADKQEVDDHQKHMKELQEEGKRKGEEGSL